MGVKLRAAALSNYVSVARQVGLDALAALRRFDLDPRVLDEPDQRIPAAAVTALLEYSAESSGCPTFGLRMAESRRLSDFGPISLMLTHERSLRDVLAALERYRTHVNEALDVRVEECGDVVIVRENLYIKGIAYPRQAYELALGVLYRLGVAMLGPTWRPISIHLAHKAPPTLETHRRIFGAACIFESEFNGMMCRAGDLDVDNQKGDPVLARYAEKFLHALPNVGAVSLSEDVRRAIQTLLPTHRASTAGVAASLGVNVRTLQRRLEDEGILFGDLLTQVRRELAERYLADKNCSLTDVAAKLGYNQLSSFTRWFTAEFRVSPSAWRAQAQAR